MSNVYELYGRVELFLMPVQDRHQMRFMEPRREIIKDMTVDELMELKIRLPKGKHAWHNHINQLLSDV